MAERIIDMSDAAKRSRFLNDLSRLQGKYRFEIKRYRPRRTDRQNRYYRPCFAHEFGKFLRDQGEHYTDEEAHEMLRHRFLRQTKEVNGERLEYTRSTTSLDTSEFNAYLDACAAWLSSFFGIRVPEPNEYREKETSTAESV